MCDSRAFGLWIIPFPLSFVEPASRAEASRRPKAACLGVGDVAQSKGTLYLCASATYNASEMMMDSNEDFEWAWAEREESAAALQASLSSFYEEDPLYELLWLCFSSPRQPFDELDWEEAKALRCPAHFPQIPERCDLLQACCQNSSVHSALEWLDFCLRETDFSCERLSAALLQGCWAGWFLGERARLAERLIEAGADSNQTTYSGDSPLLALFRAWDDPAEARFSGALAPVCKALLTSNAHAQLRNKAGESALSRINLRLSETLLGMADDQASSDLLLCAQMLLDHGAPPDSVREAPPLDLVVPHAALRGMIQGAAEKASIDDFLNASAPVKPSAGSASSRTRGSSRL